MCHSVQEFFKSLVLLRAPHAADITSWIQVCGHWALALRLAAVCKQPVKRSLSPLEVEGRSI